MEPLDYFTLRNSGIRRWLLVLGAATCILLVVAPPSLWLCGVGGVLLVLGAAVHVVRAGQWFTWPSWQPSFNWFEGWATATGALLLLLPLLAILVRVWWSV